MPRMFLNGTAMSGGADHHLVGDAELVARTTTARRYRFHAVDGRYPGLEDVGPDDPAAAVRAATGKTLRRVPIRPEHITGT